MATELTLVSDKRFEDETAIADLEKWMRREQGRLYRLCLNLLRSCDEADAAVQDVFFKAFRSLRRSGPCSIREPEKWLTRVAVHVCSDRLNSRFYKFWKLRLSGEDEQYLLTLAVSAELNPEERLFHREAVIRLNRALRRLSNRQRVVFLLRHDEGYDLGEIAEILGLDTGTVKSHMARAIGKLRAELRDLYVR